MTLLYHPVGVSPLFIPLPHYIFCEGEQSRMCRFKGLYSHLPHQDFGRGRKFCSPGCALKEWLYYCYIILASCAWLSLFTHTITHTFLPLTSSTCTCTRKPSHRVCLNCKRQDAVKKIEIWKLPRILIIILNR